jgi:hypothetical protein
MGADQKHRTARTQEHDMIAFVRQRGEVMRWTFILFLCLALTQVSHGADWRTTLTSRIGPHPPLRPLTAEYDFGWSGIKAAESTIRFGRAKGRNHLTLSAQTIGLARTLWRMDTNGVSIVNAASLRPIKLDQTEKYARKSMRMTVDFAPKGPRHLKVPTPPDPTPPKLKIFKFSDVHDLHSALLFIRSQRLRNGDTIRLCVFPGSSPYLADVKVERREKIEVAGGEWDAIACDVNLREIEKDFTLAPHAKFKKATAWLSDDDDRLLLRIEADVNIGSIWAEMRTVEFADAKPARNRETRVPAR